MIDRAEEYRLRAADCEQRAAACPDMSSRRELLGRARAWRRLALDAETLERVNDELGIDAAAFGAR